MIQLNLLPDVKLQYVKAQRQQRLMTTVAILVSLAAIVLLLLLLATDGLQKKHISDLTKDINSENSQLQNEPQINKILTVQNQLSSLTGPSGLYTTEPAAARLFTYLNEVTPVQVSINSFDIDFTQYTATITGTADSLSSVNLYVDTLKTTTYTSATDTSPLPAFSDVVLSSFGIGSSSSDPSQAANYTITLSYDKNIFDITQKINLTVPSTTATRNTTSQSTDLFKQTANSSTKGSN